MYIGFVINNCTRSLYTRIQVFYQSKNFIFKSIGIVFPYVYNYKYSITSYTGKFT